MEKSFKGLGYLGFVISYDALSRNSGIRGRGEMCCFQLSLKEESDNDTDMLVVCGNLPHTHHARETQPCGCQRSRTELTLSMKAFHRINIANLLSGESISLWSVYD